jgi:hypothetical protein
MLSGERHRIFATPRTPIAAPAGSCYSVRLAWRLKGKGPRSVRFGRAVRYLATDVERFVEASVVDQSRHAGDTNL